MFCPPYKKECVNEKETELKGENDMFKKDYSAIYNKENRDYMLAGLFLFWFLMLIAAL